MQQFTEYSRIKNVPKQEMDAYFATFEKRAKKSGFFMEKTVVLGKTLLTIDVYDSFLAKQIDTQLSYIQQLQHNDLQNTNACLVIYRDNFASLVTAPASKCKFFSLEQKDDENTSIILNLELGFMTARCTETNTFYWACNDSLEERVRRMGHLFVHQFFEIVQNSEQALLHAASVGIDNKGVLIGARGGGGKSTLAISAMLGGFRYVSDDYSIISRKNSTIYAHPVYSVVNLFPEMQEKFKDLKTKYVWNSYWQPKKETLDISAHHSSFVEQLPIKAIIFPKICAVEKPSIEAMERGKAMVQMIHSTIMQLGRQNQGDYIKIVMSLLQDLPFYQINLSPDLLANVECLRQFIKEL
jgi:hypothetical protein